MPTAKEEAAREMLRALKEGLGWLQSWPSPRTHYLERAELQLKMAIKAAEAAGITPDGKE